MIDSLLNLKSTIERSTILSGFINVELLADVHHQNEDYPLLSFTIGSSRPDAPVLFFTGGVHGIERVGAELALSFLKSTIERLVWDRALQELLENLRLVIIPLVNPVGFKKFKRSNGNNVDLMRNSPVDSDEKVPFLLGGHRFSDKLPWYRGQVGVLEEENNAVLKKFLSVAEKSPCVVSLDFHSGFGMRDRIWFPFSYTRKPFDHLSQMYFLTKLFEDTYPYHIYKIEPQSHGYLISGDLWDYAFKELKKINPESIYIPLTLEMGSWIWVKKNPMQIFSKVGVFNPIKEHRLKRTFRRHNLLLDFLMKALYSNDVWTRLPLVIEEQNRKNALIRWYNENDY